MDAKIVNCYMSGTISTSSTYTRYDVDIGGIAGCAEEVYNSNNEAVILINLKDGDDDNFFEIGGVVGHVDFIQNCYNVGAIDVAGLDAFEGDIDLGGIAGAVDTAAANCYCSSDSYSEKIGYSTGSVRNCESYTNAEMQTAEFRDLLNKNAANKEWFKWELQAGESVYPILEKLVRLDACNIQFDAPNYAYTGEIILPNITITYNGEILNAFTDYNIELNNNQYIGTATAVIEGQRCYLGSTMKFFDITAPKGKIYNVSGCKYTVTGSSTVKFSGCTSSKTKKIVIPKTVNIGGKTFKVTAVADKALKNKSKITSVTVGSNVKTIGDSAFENCKNLKSVVLGSNVTKIGNKAFKACKSLKSISLPGKVTTIGKEAFRSCSKLERITITGSKLKSVGKNALKSIKSTAIIEVPGKKFKSYKSLLKNKGQSKKVKIRKL